MLSAQIRAGLARSGGHHRRDGIRPRLLAATRALARRLCRFPCPGVRSPSASWTACTPSAISSSRCVSCLDDERCAFALADGIAQVGSHLREIAPVFARSDVYAQLLRVRLWACELLPLDLDAAGEEAEALAAFQLSSDDPRVDGAFAFGIKAGEVIPHANPVSTSFALQALHMWHTRTLPPLSP